MYWILFACVEKMEPSQEVQEQIGHEMSSFVRMSLDIRGHRPNQEELRSFQENPDLEGFVDSFLMAETFPAHSVWVWNDALHTAIWAQQYTRFGEWPLEIAQMVGWEPLASLMLIIEEDRSFLDWMRTTDEALHPITAQLWGIPYEGDDWGWSPITDRPPAGVLSSRALWLRYNADTTNRNRMRANMISRVFLCSDFLDRDGGFEFEALASALNNVEKAIQTEPGCIGCHSGLDSLGSFLGGYTERSTDLPLPQFVSYSPLQAQWHSHRLSPAYFGIPGGDVSDLAKLIAYDPRYTQCAIERYSRSLLGEKIMDPEFVAAFSESSYRIRDLLRSMVLSDYYQEVQSRILSPQELYGTLVAVFGEDIVPKELKWSHRHRVLLGAGNDYDIIHKSNAYGVSNHLVLTWLAKEITGHIAEDVERPLEERRILRLAQDDSEEHVRLQIQFWWVHLLSELVDVDDSSIDALYGLFEEVATQDSVEKAWAAVLESIIRHPKAVLR